MDTTLTPPLKWHGGKHYLAQRIIGLMPGRCRNPNSPAADDPGWLHYVEPFAGGLAVMLAQDPEGISEVANDSDLLLMNFWTVLANPKTFERFLRFTQAMPFSEDMFKVSLDLVEHARTCGCWFKGGPDKAADLARAFFVVCRQSLAGRMKSFAPLSKTRTRRGMNEQASAWLSAVDGLPDVHQRLRRVAVLRGDFATAIVSEDGPRTLYYLDPPYLPETKSRGDHYYRELSPRGHAVLLATLARPGDRPWLTDEGFLALAGQESLGAFRSGLSYRLEGRFLLSGYPNSMYNEWMLTNDFRSVSFDLPNNAAGGVEKRRMEEVVWMNYPPAG